jgi:hypothetical protein
MDSQSLEGVPKMMKETLKVLMHMLLGLISNDKPAEFHSNSLFATAY